MSYRREPFVPGEWYHCYTRGIDKRKTFLSHRDYQRYIEALYLSNCIEPVMRKDVYREPHDVLLKTVRNKPLVSIGAYCLMPNHVHILIKEIEENGISRFMQRVGTSYTKYFNEKNQRIGNLFVGPFRSKHVGDDVYLRKLVQYIHLNPAEIFEPMWKKGGVKNLDLLQSKLESYQYSSLTDYLGASRADASLLDFNEITSLLYHKLGSLSELLDEAHEYFASLK